jgi:hypothetical protein
MQGYSLSKVAEHATAHCGARNPINTNYVSRVLHDLRGVSGKFLPSALFSIEEMRCVAEFAAGHYRKRNDETVTEWLKKTGKKIPRTYPAETGFILKNKKKGDTHNKIMLKYLRSLEVRINKIEQGVKPNIENTKKEQIPEGRKNDPRMDSLQKSVNSFVFNEPIQINQVWKDLQQIFEARNGLKVFRVGDQTFPQWLRSEEWLDTFLQELPGFLDEIHDRLHAPQISTWPQGELGL